MEDPRPFDSVATELFDDAADKMKWNRRQAQKLLDKAEEIEEVAAITADKLREAAAALIMEAQLFNEVAGDLLTAEFPMTGEDNE